MESSEINVDSLWNISFYTPTVLPTHTTQTKGEIIDTFTGEPTTLANAHLLQSESGMLLDIQDRLWATNNNNSLPSETK